MASPTSALPAVSAAVPPPPPPKMPSQLNPAPAKTTNAAAPISPQRQLQFTGDGGARPPMMNIRGRRAIAAGFAVLVLSVGAGVNLISGSAFGLLLSFAGVLAGVNAIAAGVRTTKDAAPVGRPAVFAGVGAPPALRRRGLAAVGLFVASSAVAAVAGEAGAGVSFMMFVLLLLGVALVNAGVRSAY